MTAFETDLLERVNNIDLLSCCEMTQKYLGDGDFFETHCYGTSIKVALAINRKYGSQFGEDYVKFNKVADDKIDEFTEFVLSSDNTLFTFYAFGDGPKVVLGDDGYSMSIIVRNKKFYILESRYRQFGPRIRQVESEEIDEKIFELCIQGKLKWLCYTGSELAV